MFNLKGRIHSQIGLMKWQMGDYEMAIIHYDESLKITSHLYGDESPECVGTVMNKGGSLQNMNMLDEAIQAYNQCLKILTKDEDTKQRNKELIASTYNHLGVVYYKKDDHGNALKHYKESLELKRELYGKEAKNEDIASTLMKIGLCHEKRTLTMHSNFTMTHCKQCLLFITAKTRMIA